MKVAIKFEGDENDVRKLVSILEAIVESDAFNEVELADYYEEKE